MSQQKDDAPFRQELAEAIYALESAAKDHGRYEYDITHSVLSQARARLDALVGALVEDAERYRIVRDNPGRAVIGPQAMRGGRTLDEWCDAARAAGPTRHSALCAVYWDTETHPDYRKCTCGYAARASHREGERNEHG